MIGSSTVILIISMQIFSNRLFFTYIICSATLAQVLSDLYLPSLPYIQKDLLTSTNLVQFSVTLFMFGFSSTQLFYGSLSDAFGRKYTFLTSLIIANFGSIIAIYSCNITMLFISRLFQGIGAAGCVVTSRAMIRDICPEHLLARMISYITITRGVIFIFIPILGGYIQNIWGWQTHFLILFIYTFIYILIQIFFIKETNLHLNKQHIQPRKILQNLYQLFSHKRFIYSCIASMLAYGGLSAWLTVGPFIIQDIYGYNAIEFGYISAAIGLYFAAGGFINSRIATMRVAPAIIRMGFFCAFFPGYY